MMLQCISGAGGAGGASGACWPESWFAACPKLDRLGLDRIGSWHCVPGK